MNNRFKNKGLWISVFAFIPMLLQGLQVYDIHAVLPENYADLTNAFLGILVLAGVLSNPTSENKGYLDDKEENK